MNRTHPEFERKMVFPRELDLEGPGRRDYFVKFEHPTEWGFLLIPCLSPSPSSSVGTESTRASGWRSISHSGSSPTSKEAQDPGKGLLVSIKAISTWREL